MNGPAGPDQIKPAILKGQVLDIPLVERHAVLELALLQLFPGDLQQRGRHIRCRNTPYRPHRAGQQSHESARSGACLQNRSARGNFQPIDYFLVHIILESVGAKEIRWVVGAVPVLMLVSFRGHIVSLPAKHLTEVIYYLA